MIRNAWKKFIPFNTTTGWILVLLLGIPRFFIVLNANVTSNYKFVPAVFIAMIVITILLLNKEGRKNIGIQKPGSYSWLFLSFLVGAIPCALAFITGKILYDHSLSNWFVYISKSYQVAGATLNTSERFIYFMIYAITGMTFSPFGEEIFYRGLVHGAFATNYGERKASTADSAAFAVTHLAHFGLIYFSGHWRFLFIPAVLWVALMFIASNVFFFCKQKTGSVWGAVAAHAGYNVAMMYFIFYHILA